MITKDHWDVTADTLRVMEHTHDLRLRDIMVSLVRYLHGFIRDVRLTDAEFRHATAILNGIGKVTTDTHNEESGRQAHHR
jgi:catechol 1,2-dioxygenase